MDNVERLIKLQAELDDWNRLTPTEQTAELQAGRGVPLSSKDMAALLDVVLGLVRRLS